MRIGQNIRIILLKLQGLRRNREAPPEVLDLAGCRLGEPCLNEKCLIDRGEVYGERPQYAAPDAVRWTPKPTERY